MRRALAPPIFFLAILGAAAPVQSQVTPPLRVFLRAGEKTHGPGEHDHPRFLADWTPLLRERGCEVRGALAFPTREELAATDVVVFFCAEGASIFGDDRAHLLEYLERGGGLVFLHDSVCGDDPHWFKTIAGGAWEHGRATWHEGKIGLCFARDAAGTEREHPITRGVANFDLDDEIYSNLHLVSGVHVLANSFQTPFDVTPQMWTFEQGNRRAFVSLQGHEYATFSHPAWRTLVLRGIAWAGKRDADSLVGEREIETLAYPPGGPKRPEEERASFVLESGFRIDCVAAEPLVVNPISLDWDPRGRMWVALTPGYPDKQEFSGIPARDRIVILEDADHDGRAEGTRVFADGLDLVTSFVFHRDGVIVTQAPDILFLRDTDGDDRADRREVLYHGFGYGDTHAVISNLRAGLDGWIYGTQGYSGNDSRDIVGSSGTPFGRIGNGIFRFHPDGSAIEQVAAFGSNTWGLDFARDGTLFFSMANGSHLRHLVVEDRDLSGGRLASVESWLDVTDHGDVRPLTKNARPPYQQIDFVGGFTAAAGACLYDGGAWPAQYVGDHFVCEPTVNLVHRDALAPRGVTFQASRPEASEFLASTDLWFRPVHLRVGPDGALYVLDFYNQAAVHNDTRGPPHGPTNAARRPDRDHDHGRIWRIQSLDAPPPILTPVRGAERSDGFADLASPNGWRRASAHRLVRERGLGRDERAELALLARRSAEPDFAIHALWLTRDGELARHLAESPQAEVRRNALAVLHDADGFTWMSVSRVVRARLFDPDPRVRLEALRLLRGRAETTDFFELVSLYPDLEDAWSRSLVLAIAAERPAEFLSALVRRTNPEPFLEFLDRLAASAAERGDFGEALEMVLALGEAEPPARLAERVLRALAAAFPHADQPWPSPKLGTALRRLFAHGDVRVGVAALPIARRWAEGQFGTSEFDAMAARIAAVVEDPEAEVELRLACLRSLLDVPESRSRAVASASRFLDPFFPAERQAEVVRWLAELPEVSAARTLLDALPGLSGGLRESVYQALVERARWTLLLLDAVEAGRVKPVELGPRWIHRLRNHPDPSVADRASALALLGTEAGDVEKILAGLLPLVDAPGDAARGKQLFAEQCAKCHAFQGEGAHVGPDLTGMGAHGARELLPFLVDPNRSVEPGYVEYVLETTAGRLVDGVIVRDDQRSVVLRNATGDVEVARDEIASLRSTGRSPMPTGFEALGAEALRDLLAFLTGGYQGFRVLSLAPLASASTARGMYDVRRDAQPMRLSRTGIVDVQGIPFEVLAPERSPQGKNVLVLRGGMVEDWDSKRMPARVELPIGFAFARLHVLGGIAAWGYPFTQERAPAAKLSLLYADGEAEEHVFVDGREFADWIRRSEVPGSEWVDLVEEGSAGQVRRFHVDLRRPGAVVQRIVLESFDNDLAPTFVALTAELAAAASSAAPSGSPGPLEEAPESTAAPRMLTFGGGSSHDYQRWFGEQDLETLSEWGPLEYTEDPRELAARLAGLAVLVLCNNQPLSDADLRRAIFAFVGRGGGLLLLHASTWHNWTDWPEYNAELVGGGARSHEEYREFAVRIADPAHPLSEGLPRSFSITDELYRFEPLPGAPSQVVATGTSLATGAEFPVAWAHVHGRGRIVAITLGHDGAAHESRWFQRLLQNAVRWLRAD